METQEEFVQSVDYFSKNMSERLIQKIKNYRDSENFLDNEQKKAWSIAVTSVIIRELIYLGMDDFEESQEDFSLLVEQYEFIGKLYDHWIIELTEKTDT